MTASDVFSFQPKIRVLRKICEVTDDAGRYAPQQSGDPSSRLVAGSTPPKLKRTLASDINKASYLGVVWREHSKLWEARIHDGKRVQFLGRFSDVRDAARKFDQAAMRLYGRAARTNFDDPATCEILYGD